eukprot:3555413-Amphidinium_carterae.2
MAFPAEMPRYKAAALQHCIYSKVNSQITFQTHAKQEASLCNNRKASDRPATHAVACVHYAQVLLLELLDGGNTKRSLGLCTS